MIHSDSVALGNRSRYDRSFPGMIAVGLAAFALGCLGDVSMIRGQQEVAAVQSAVTHHVVGEQPSASPTIITTPDGMVAFLPGETPFKYVLQIPTLENERGINVHEPDIATSATVRVPEYPAGTLNGPVDWHNHGGNEKKNGLSGISGPNTPELLWENDDDFAIIAFQPYVLNNRVFVVRYRDFVGLDAEDEIVACDLETGAELWSLLLPYGGNSSVEWGAHILGVNNGSVYASRSGNGNSIEDHVAAYSAADGSFLWTSEDTTDTGFYGGAVFAPDGDLIVGSFDHINRIEASDGSRVWSVPRSCPTSGACPAPISNTGLFINIPRPGGNTAVAKHDLETGAFLYRGPDLPGIITQNAPFVSPDGSTIYQAKQHATAVNFLYAFTDTGTALVQKWSRPVAYSAYHLHGIGPGGSIYAYLENDEFVRLDPATGEVLNTAGILSPRSAGVQTAVGSDGTVYLSNGWASNPPQDGRLWALTADLKLLFTLELDRQNSGGPALASNGSLIVADRTSIRAYKSPAVLLGDVNQDGEVDLLDIAPFIDLLVNSGYQAEADINVDGEVSLLDVLPFVSILSGG